MRAQSPYPCYSLSSVPCLGSGSLLLRIQSLANTVLWPKLVCNKEGWVPEDCVSDLRRILSPQPKGGQVLCRGCA